jgi:putative SOS response-associated peptidase YedK
MCGRYGLVFAGQDFEKRFNLVSPPPKTESSYNIAPGMMEPVVTRNSPNTAKLMKWGLVPFWAKDPRIGYKMINARAETVAIAPSFRKPFHSSRCLIPASFFFEWDKSEKPSQPYAIRLKDHSTFSFAGLYDTWKDAEGKEFQSFTIITTTPNTLVGPIHNRMPVILHKGDEDSWLDPQSNAPLLLKFLSPYPAEEMEMYRVSSAVNSPRNDSPDLIRPLAS